jgi:hypothetical protein
MRTRCSMHVLSYYSDCHRLRAQRNRHAESGSSRGSRTPPNGARATGPWSLTVDGNLPVGEGVLIAVCRDDDT